MLLRSVEWLIAAESAQLICPVFKGQSVQELIIAFSIGPNSVGVSNFA
jgi:hypothetical protein